MGCYASHGSGVTYASPQDFTLVTLTTHKGPKVPTYIRVCHFTETRVRCTHVTMQRCIYAALLSTTASYSCGAARTRWETALKGKLQLQQKLQG